MVPVGEELKYVGYRLSDIIFFAEKTTPVQPWWKPWRWKQYNASVLRMIADQARQAQRYLSVANNEH